MKITDVSWIRDAHDKLALELLLDGHPVRIRSSQRTELTERGLLDGVVFLDSERAGQMLNPYVHGNYAPAFAPRDLIGCTDDPAVFALYQTMCAAIREDRWRVGVQPTAG